uniref:PABS domain-containing protein n=2 Tax=Parascaris univalens TaxID=6257 RepID=A0A914ZJ77_PARUN
MDLIYRKTMAGSDCVEFMVPFIGAFHAILYTLLVTWIVECAKKKKVEVHEPADPNTVLPVNLPPRPPAIRPTPTAEQKDVQKKDQKKDSGSAKKKDEKKDEKSDNKKDEKTEEKKDKKEDEKKDEKRDENKDGKSTADEVKEGSKSPMQEEKPTDEQKDSGKPAPEIKPKVIARNAKEERIAKGKEMRGKGDYPTMDDVLSDWDSEKEKKDENDEDGDKVKSKTNLEEAADKI